MFARVFLLIIICNIFNSSRYLFRLYQISICTSQIILTDKDDVVALRSSGPVIRCKSVWIFLMLIHSLFIIRILFIYVLSY